MQLFFIQSAAQRRVKLDLIDLNGTKDKGCQLSRIII